MEMIMKLHLPSTIGLVLLVVGIATLGCSTGPTAVKVPPIEPETMATNAFTKYDKNADGFLDQREMSAFPALLDAMNNQIDKDNDKRISKKELADRFKMWLGGVGATTLFCRITRGGQPVEGALVKLIPDDCFGGVIQPAEGTTRANGRASMGIDPVNLPADLQNLRAVQQGLYRVEITHPSMQVPPKYNTQSTLGVEVSFESGRNVVEFKL
jgi:hypothetical protein